MPVYSLRGRAPRASLVGRRRLILASAGAVAGAALAATAAHASDDRDDHERGRRSAPLPIPGGIQIGPTPDDVIHVWAPGPSTTKLPFSGAPLQGHDYDSTTIYTLDGNVAIASHAGRGVAGDGTPYNLETDVRAFEGRFALADGTKHEASFALI